MARKRVKKKPAPREARDARVAANWRGAAPRYMKWLAGCAAVTAALFMYNQLGHPAARVLAVTGMGFEAARVCTAASALAVMMALFLGREREGGRRRSRV